MEVNREIVSEAISVTSARQLGEPEPELPHPLVTDQILSKHMDSIGHHTVDSSLSDTPRSVTDRVGDRAKGRNLEQAQFNSHVTHIFHQFDHRDRQQRAEILGLRDELASALAKLDSMERRLSRLEPSSE